VTETEAFIQEMFDVSVSCCGDIPADDACKRCRLLSQASHRIAKLVADVDRLDRVATRYELSIAGLTAERDTARRALVAFESLGPLVARTREAWEAAERHDDDGDEGVDADEALLDAVRALFPRPSGVPAGGAS